MSEGRSLVREYATLPVGRGRLKRFSRASFWLGLPLMITIALLWPRRVVIYMGGDVPEINRPRSILPGWLGDVTYLYGASVVGVGALLVTTTILRFVARRRAVPTPSLTACFLPTYLAGIEATGHVRWASRCHTMGPINLPEYFLGEVQTCAAAFAITVLAGGVAALSLGHRSRFGLPIPPVVWAILLSAWWPWWALLRLVSF